MHHPYQPYETWPDELRRLPEIWHPDGRRLINNNMLAGLFRIGESAIRERRRNGQLPPSIYKEGNRHFSDLQIIANIYLHEFPGKIVEPAPAPPTDIPLTVRPDSKPAHEESTELAPHQAETEMEPAGDAENAVSASSDVRQELRQLDVERLTAALERIADMPITDPTVTQQLASGVEAARHLFGQILNMEKETDGQLSALTRTTESQARIIESQQAEIQALRATSAKPSEPRQNFWQRLFNLGGPKAL
jgi:hypothetical protein